jgi:hypothetical protein
MTARCSSDMPTITAPREDGAGSSRAGAKRKLVHYERFTELPYINPACIKVKDLMAVMEKVRKVREEKK